MSEQPIRRGVYRAEKIQYKDGVGCCVWEPLGDPEDEDFDERCGIGFDFAYDNLDDLIGVLEALKEIEAEPYEEAFPDA